MNKASPNDMPRKKRQGNMLSPFRIAAIYAAIGWFWILFSDSLLALLVTDPATFTKVSIYKGWIYVLLTAVLLYWLVKQHEFERRKTVGALAESEQYNRELFYSLPIGLTLCRMDGSFIDVNKAFAKIIGRTVEETLNLSYWDITPEKYAEQETLQLEALNNTGRYGSYEKEYIYRDGHLVPVRLQGLVIERGGQQLILSSVEDITESRKALDALRLSEEKYSTTFRNSPDAIVLTSLPDGRIVEVNERFLHVSGYALSEVVGQTTLELNIWANVAERQQHFEKVQAHGSVAEQETVFRLRSGETIPGTISSEIIELEGRKYILSVIHDITERKQSEDILREKEYLLSESQRIAHVGSWSLHPGSSGIVWSSETYRIFGVSPETFVPTVESFIQLIHPDDQAAMQEWISSCVKEERPGDLEFRAIHPDGTVRIMTGRGYLQYDMENRPFRMIGTVQDITSLKLAEAALRRSEEKFFTTFHNSPDAIMLTSLPDGKLVEANERFMRISGYSPEQIFGHSSLELNIWANPAERQRYFELLQAHGSVSNMEADYRMKSGEILNGMISGEIIEVQGSKYILSVVRDITERKQAELELKKYRDSLEELVKERTAELQRSQRALVNMVEDLNLKTKELKSANDKLKELDRLKSMFIASMSHELRTPLNSIIGFTGIILQGMTGEITAEQRDQLQRVSRAGKHLLALITDVIDISKIEAGKIDVSVEEFSLDALLNEAAATLKPQISEKGLDLEVRMAPGDVVMKTDRKRLFQSVLNYLSNAVKFTEKGKIMLDSKKTGDMIEIHVTDTGIGIQSQEFPRLFQSFVRLDTPPGISTAGTGLGLYLTKKLVTEILGGTVSVTSRYGEGSTFSMKIPVRIYT